MLFSKKTMSVIIGAALSAIILTACGGQKTDSASEPDQTANEPEAAGETRTLTDGMGNTVEVPVHPERIIASYLEDHLVALGMKPVAQWSVNDGQSIQGYLQDDLEGIPTIPHDLPFEAVQALKPDLIIMDSASMVEGGKYEQYSQIAPTYVIGKDVNTDWREELKLIGEVLGKEEEANKVLEEYEAKAAEAKAVIEEKAGRPPVAAVWLVGGQFFIVNEHFSSGAVMYGDLGLKAPQVVQEISENTVDNWSPISLEKLVELDAEYLFLINSDGNESTPLSDTLWKSVPAVQAGNVFEFSENESWLYTGAIANSQIIDHILDCLGE